MRFVLASLLLLTSCSAPSRQCESQFDCFGSEICVDGECVKRVVIIDDMSPSDGVDVGNNSADQMSDGGANNATDMGPNNIPDPPDMSPVDAGPCSPPCDEGTVCSGFGTCVAVSTDTVWMLDDVEVARHRTAEGYYYPANDSLYIAIPYWGRNVTVTVEDVSTATPFSATCTDFQDPAFGLNLITTDNSWAELDALPARWSGLIATDASCASALTDGDTLERWDLEITALSPTAATGSVAIEIAGAGPRAGETLRITSSFDVELEEM